MSQTSDRDLEVFAEAVSLPPNARAAFLARACEGDEELRQRVEALLRTHDRAGDFLEASPADALRTRPPAAGFAAPGERIGRYRLLETLGEGGYGVVYLAEQEEPLRRQVALKVIKPGMDTKSVIARFEAERQALALMDHPNIAKVFDAGSTASGHPYFVMELVRGTRITEYCDQQRLTLEQRLCLFVQVCLAVQHAHQKGIIHRDLKPSNILVTTCDEGEPVPVVIDFGIAKAAGHLQLTPETFGTGLELLIGTPAYMSPEQATLSGADVDTRTDIYSLGVLLYELLTGAPLFDSLDPRKAGLDEIRRVIREQDPLPPSQRLARMTAATLSEVAHQRRSDPPRLLQAVAGDLDCLVLRALEKERARRYETANGLALDIKRFLADEPIIARPPSRRYRLAKLIRRNRGWFAGLTAAATLLLISLVVISAALAKERQARRHAETESARSRQVTRLLETMLEGVGPSVARGEDTRMLRGILDQTAERLGAELAGQPAVEAQLRALMGRLYLEIGRYEAAEGMHEGALTLLEQLPGDQREAIARAKAELGNVYWKQRRLAEAETAYSAALALRRQALGEQHPDVATSLTQLGGVYRRQKRLPEAENLTREGLAIRQHHFGPAHLEVADSLRNLAIILRDEGRNAEAERCARDMLDLRRRLLGNDHPLVAAALSDLAWVLGNDQASEVESLQTEAFGIQRNVLGDEHPEVARSLYQLGERLRVRGANSEAHAVLRAALSIQRTLLGDAHPDVLATWRGLALTLEQEGRWEEAETAHRTAIRFWRQRTSASDPQLREELESLGYGLIRLRRWPEADAFFVETLTPEFRARPESARLLALRVDLLARLERWEEAIADATAAQHHEPDNPERYHVRGALLARFGSPSAYAALCAEFARRFGETTDAFVADQVAKTCALRPEAVPSAEILDRLATLALTSSAADAHVRPYFEVGKALTQWRLGQPAAALEWARKTLASSRRFAHGQARAVEAMALAQLGDRAGAQHALDAGMVLAPAQLPTADREDPDRAWLAWVFSRVLLEEAAQRLANLAP